MIIIDGKKVAQDIRLELKTDIDKLKKEGKRRTRFSGNLSWRRSCFTDIC